MKHLLHSLLLFFTAVCSAQDYQPLPLDSGSGRWRTITYDGTAGNGNVYTYHLSYEPAGDTIIQSNSYAKFRYFGTPGGLFVRGFIRQDSASRMVWIWPQDSLSEYVLFDFNQQPGDTLNSYLAEVAKKDFGQEALLISSADSVMLGGKYRRRFKTVPVMEMSEMQIIEGVGTDRGLFTIPMEFEIMSSLMCVSENGIKFYPDSTGTCENAMPGVRENRPPPLALAVPNPVRAGSSLYVGSGWAGAGYVLYGTRGEVLDRGTVDNGFIHLPGDLASGLCTLLLTGSGHPAMVRVLVEK